MDLKTWFKETRPNFLLLTPITFSVGLAVAYAEGSFNPFRAFIGLIGVLLAHVSINVINDYFDYKSGLDFKTKPTPFSGGSGILPSGTLKPKDVYYFALSCLGIGFVIGVYFVLTTGWMLLPLIVLAALTIYFYTPSLSHWYIGEIFTGLNFGPLMVLGGDYIMTGRYSIVALAAGIIPGILVGTLLFLNEFPDVEADKEVGRKNIIIILGLSRSSKIYAVLIASTYVWTVVSVFFRLMPVPVMVNFLTLPIAMKTIKGVLKHHSEIEQLIPHMGSNVILVLSMTFLTSVGFLLSRIF